ANTNGYQYKQIIKVVDSQKPVIEDCPPQALSIADSTVNDDQLWNEPYWLDPLTGQRDLSDASVTLSITATDACAGEDVDITYLLFLDLDGNGDQETVINSNNLPAANTIKFNNAFNPNYTGGSTRSFDERMVSSLEKYRFALQTTVSNHKKTAWVRWHTGQIPQQYFNPQLPRGTHKIIWRVTDACGNETTCQYNFSIHDGQPPTPACSGIFLVRNIAPNHLLSVDVNEIPQLATDNYTPPPQLEYAIRRPGTGNDFPLNGIGAPNHMISFDCADLGQQSIQLWVRDHDLNASFCTLPITIQDGNSICSHPLVNIAGTIKTPIDTGLTDATISIYATFPGLLPATETTMTDSAGHFVFPTQMPSGTTYTLTPTKDGNTLNGVSTLDLVLINRHILGLEAITSPYKLIAADANKSNSVTTFDVVELRKLILGIYPSSLPLLKSWRFVDAAFVFPNPVNPFQTPFPEFRTVDSLVANQAPDNFVGIKVGDVNCSAYPSLQAATEDRSLDTLWFDLPDRLVQRGEIFDLPFRASEVVAGYQFTLDYPGLEILEVQPGAQLQPENFAVFADRHAMTTSFDAAEWKDGPAEFNLRCQALQTGRLHQILHLSDRITPAEAYRSAQSGSRMQPSLRFGPGAPETGGFELLPAVPNPFSEQTTIRFRLPAAMAATLSIYDATGHLRYSHTDDYGRGLHTWTIRQAELGTAGVLFYKLETAAGSALGRLVLVR
ncbi:MAG: T9SS type A sorting domain-containing protein, partial [Saprospiraceae bacterium]